MPFFNTNSNNLCLGCWEQGLTRGYHPRHPHGSHQEPLPAKSYSGHHAAIQVNRIQRFIERLNVYVYSNTKHSVDKDNLFIE